jgi:hypothetical protein
MSSAALSTIDISKDLQFEKRLGKLPIQRVLSKFQNFDSQIWYLINEVEIYFK